MITIKDIAPSFCFLEDKGYIQIKEHYKPDSFGDTLIILIGEGLSIKIFRDRSQIFIEIGSDQKNIFYKLEDILQFIDPSIQEDKLGSPPNIEILAKLSRERWHSISNLFRNQKLLESFEVYVKEKTVKLLKRIFRKN